MSAPHGYSYDYLCRLVSIERENRSIRDDRLGVLPVWAYRSVAELLIAHGTHYTETTPAAPFLSKGFVVAPQHCFDNAYRLARRRKTLRYVEGYAMSVIPMYHAWCITADNVVVDPTWELTASIVRPSCDDYFGVPISLATAKRVRSSRCVAVLDNYVGKYPMLREPYDVARESVR